MEMVLPGVAILVLVGSIVLLGRGLDLWGRL